MFTISAPRMTIRFVALLTAVSLVLSAFPAAFFVANAQEVPPVEETTTETPVEEETVSEEVAEEETEEPIEEVMLLLAPIVIEEPTEGSATLVAHKIVCDDEATLPNWGSITENADITADTAADWVETHPGCHFEAGWQFEWAVFGSTGNPGDTLVGSAGEPWTTFGATDESGMTSTVIPESAFEAGIWVREVLQAGYIPYTYNPEKVNTNEVSAEIYCNSDVVNYDNFDYVGGLEDDSTYYCVAWNVLAADPEPTEDITACKLDEKNNPVAGWEMNIQSEETEETILAVTGENGCVSVAVDPEDGPWIVKEGMQEGWSQLDVNVNNGDIYANEGESDRYCVFYDYKDYKLSRSEFSEILVVDNSRTCTFTNKAPEKESKGSSGTRTKNKPKGQVLGASTQCGLWLNDYMQKATENDTYQVLKLQAFLTFQGFATPLTGIFDATTEANVKLFQAKYADTVIKPWFDKGIVPHNRPTGFVYKTTRWQINDIMCPGIEAYPSFEGENLSTNVLINR